MLRQFVYPANVERDEAGYFLVTFPDLPEAGTDSETLEEALTEASDCLAEAWLAALLALRTSRKPHANRGASTLLRFLLKWRPKQPSTWR